MLRVLSRPLVRLAERCTGPSRGEGPRPGQREWWCVPELPDRLRSGARQRGAEVRQQANADLLIRDDFLVHDMADWEVGYLDQIFGGPIQAAQADDRHVNVTGQDLVNDGPLARMVDWWRERFRSQSVVLHRESMRGNVD